MTGRAPRIEPDEDIRQLVDQAPPLSESTRARLAALLMPVRDDITAAQQLPANAEGEAA